MPEFTNEYSTRFWTAPGEPIHDNGDSMLETSQIGLLSNYAGYYFEAMVYQYFQQKAGETINTEFMNAQQAGALKYFSSDKEIVGGKGGVYLTQQQFADLRRSINECAKVAVEQFLIEMFDGIMPSGNVELYDFLGKLKGSSGEAKLEMKFQYTASRNIKYSTLNADTLFGEGVLRNFFEDKYGDQFWTHKHRMATWVKLIRTEGFGRFLAENYNTNSGSAEILNLFLSKEGATAPINKKLVYSSSIQSGAGRTNAVIVIDLDVLVSMIKEQVSYQLPGKGRVSLAAKVGNKTVMRAAMTNMSTIGDNSNFTIMTYLSQKWLQRMTMQQV